MRKFLATALEIIAILGFCCVLDRAGHRVVKTQDRALNQFHLSGGIATQTRSLPLAPSLRRGGFTPTVWRRRPTRNTKAGSWICHRLTGIDRAARVGSIGNVGFCETIAGRLTNG